MWRVSFNTNVFETNWMCVESLALLTQAVELQRMQSKSCCSSSDSRLTHTLRGVSVSVATTTATASTQINAAPFRSDMFMLRSSYYTCTASVLHAPYIRQLLFSKPNSIYLGLVFHVLHICQAFFSKMYGTCKIFIEAARFVTHVSGSEASHIHLKLPVHYMCDYRIQLKQSCKGLLVHFSEH